MVGWVTTVVGTRVPGMAEGAVWLEELLEFVAMPVGSDNLALPSHVPWELPAAPLELSDNPLFKGDHDAK